MSSISRSPDDRPDSTEEPEKPKAGSPGRYSLASEEGEAVPQTRVDSTLGMAAVRPETMRTKPELPPIPASSGALPKVSPPKKPIGLPVPPPIPGKPPTHPTNRAMPAPLARGAAPVSSRSLDSMASRIDKIADEIESGPEITRPPESRTSFGTSRPPSIVPPAPTRRVSSLRPPPPPKRKSIAPPPPPPSFQPPSVTFDNLDEGSIAFAFDALVSEGPAGEPGTHEFDLAPVRELFSELAANHMRHVRDFMIDVKWGEVTRDWIHICVPPVRTLRRAAERLDLVELGKALERLGKELDAANAVGGQMLDAKEKERLLEAYGALVGILPQAFALDRDKSQREAVIVQALLLQVPDVRKVTIDKLHAAGLTGLSSLFEANATDIAHVAGIPHALAAKIVDRVQAYRDELKSASPQDARAAEREKLAALNARLKQHHDAYEAAANGWGPESKARKRDHFRGREEVWLEISVLLARFGEVDRLQGIEKVPFATRIAQLTEYLAEARDKYRAAES